MADSNPSITVDETKDDPFAELLRTPISEDEARRTLGDIDVKVAQLTALRMQRSVELAQLDYQLALAQLDRTVVFRRGLNPPEETK